jgi:hypothetical protein
MKDQLKLFSDFMEEMHALFSDRKINLHSIDEKLPIALMARIMCGCDSLLALLNGDMYTYAPMVLRAVEEASVDLHNLAEDQKYILTMKYSFAEQEKRILGYLEGKNEYASYFTIGSVARKRLDKAREFIKNNKQRREDSKIEARFTKAGLIDEHKTTYNDLCRSTHSNIDKLLENHIKNNGEDVVVHDQSDTKQVTRLIDLALGICITCADIIAKKYKFEKFDLTIPNELVKQFREKYITSKN